MLKKEFIEKFAYYNKIEYKEAHNHLNNFIKFTINILRTENTLVLRGFGTFYKRKRKAHTVKSLHSKETIFLNEKEYIYFKPSPKLLKNDNNNSFF